MKKSKDFLTAWRVIINYWPALPFRCWGWWWKDFCDDSLKQGLNIHIHQEFCVRACVCQVHLSVLAVASDSVLNGSLSHMATCQQAGRGNIIQRRKAAAISPCALVWESAQFHSRLRLFICIPNSLFLSLCLRSSLWLLLPALRSVPALSSRLSSQLHYDVGTGFSAVSTQRYDSVTSSLINVCLLFLFKVKLKFLDIQLSWYAVSAQTNPLFYSKKAS